MSGAGALDGILGGRDFVIDQRRFHRNCKCRLCLLSKKKKPTTTCHQSPAVPTIGYPIRRSWSEGTLALNTSPCTTSPVTAAPAGDNPYYIRRQKSAALFDVEDQD